METYEDNPNAKKIARPFARKVRPKPASFRQGLVKAGQPTPPRRGKASY